MSLKAIIDRILRDQHRSLSWLAVSMGKTFDGLRLGLINESIKYKDILVMAEILDVSPAMFFKNSMEESNPLLNSILGESVTEYGESLKNCKELNAALKDQLNDKERIISLLNQANGTGN